MYIPRSFKEDRPEVLHALMREHPLALLVSHGPGGPRRHAATRRAVRGRRRLHGVLRAHLARANPLGAVLAEAPDCLLVFQGEDGYVSPSWYPSKAQTGRAVPTWNYVTVHAHGQARVTDDSGLAPPPTGRPEHPAGKAASAPVVGRRGAGGLPCGADEGDRRHRNSDHTPRRQNGN